MDRSDTAHPAELSDRPRFPYPQRDPSEVRIGVFRAHPHEVRHGRLLVPGLVPDLSPVVAVIGGRAPGPAVLVTAGVHGAEVSSIQAARELVKSIDPDALCGTVAIVPVLNVPAFRERRLYVTPLDGKNLNRVFPGQARGSASQRIAHVLTEEVLPAVDVAMDLHGGDLVEALDPFAFVSDPPPDAPSDTTPDAWAESLRLARRAGVGQVIRGRIPGTLAETALALGKPAWIMEAGGQGVVDPAAAGLLADGVRAVLSDLGMLPDSPRRAARLDPVLRPAWTWLESPADGLWDPVAHVGQEVRAGELLGTVSDLVKDEVTARIEAPCDGRVVFLVTALSTTVGTPLLAVAAPAIPWD